jgi:single-strand DNA-binding protein
MINNVTFLSKKSNGQEGGYQSNGYQNDNYQQPFDDAMPFDDSADDVPF